MANEHPEELVRILNKAFDDLKKRITSYVVKQEKKIARDMKLATKVSKKPEPRRERGKDNKKSSRSSSSSSSSSSRSK
jgi:hypothetical protein